MRNYDISKKFFPGESVFGPHYEKEMSKEFLAGAIIEFKTIIKRH